MFARGRCRYPPQAWPLRLHERSAFFIGSVYLDYTCRLLRPEQPCDCNGHLYAACNPQGYLHAIGPLANEATANGPSQNGEESQNPAVPLDVVFRYKLLICEDVVKHARQHHRR